MPNLCEPPLGRDIVVSTGLIPFCKSFEQGTSENLCVRIHDLRTLLLPAGKGGDSLCAVQACKQRWSRPAKTSPVSIQPPRPVGHPASLGYAVTGHSFSNTSPEKVCLCRYNNAREGATHAYTKLRRRKPSGPRQSVSLLPGCNFFYGVNFSLNRNPLIPIRITITITIRRGLAPRSCNCTRSADAVQ